MSKLLVPREKNSITYSLLITWNDKTQGKLLTYALASIAIHGKLLPRLAPARRDSLLGKEDDD